MTSFKHLGSVLVDAFMDGCQVLGRRLNDKGRPEQAGPDPAALDSCVIVDNGASAI